MTKLLVGITHFLYIGNNNDENFTYKLVEGGFVTDDFPFY